ncbi:alpha/beta hydrolase [Microbacterium sp. NPDC096154]|uniref:alpha/beta fold hydrolase n=1 Tax=Microbacterium sp. NPDC096154 TaxID=3155549 RepID=UPI00332F52AD
MTDLILIPGLWLDASSWEPILPALEAAGHRPHPVTLPGVGAPAEQSAHIRLADWIDAVVARIDDLDGPVVLVGHSGGGNVAYGAADRCVGKVARVVLVDTMPPASGASISEFPAVDGVVPFPGWDFFDEEDVYDIDAPTRERTAPRMKTVPAHVPTDELLLVDDARFTVPVTVLSGGHDEAALRELISQWPAWRDAFDAIESVEVVRLGTGHWPQFTRPEVLAQAIVAAVPS